MPKAIQVPADAEVCIRVIEGTSNIMLVRAASISLGAIYEFLRVRASTLLSDINRQLDDVYTIDALLPTPRKILVGGECTYSDLPKDGMWNTANTLFWKYTDGHMEVDDV